MTDANLHYDQHDPRLVALLDDALAAGTPNALPPDDLAQRIMTLTVIAPALDAALGAEAIEPPAGLVAGILAQTRDAGRRNILARIGPTWTRRCRYAAAVVIFAAELGITMSVINILSDARGFWQMRDELRSIARYNGPAAPIDTAIDQLALRLEQPQPHMHHDWPAVREAMSELVTDLEAMALQDDDSPLY